MNSKLFFLGGQADFFSVIKYFYIFWDECLRESHSVMFNIVPFLALIDFQIVKLVPFFWGLVSLRNILLILELDLLLKLIAFLELHFLLVLVGWGLSFLFFLFFLFEFVVFNISLFHKWNGKNVLSLFWITIIYSSWNNKYSNSFWLAKTLIPFQNIFHFFYIKINKNWIFWRWMYSKYSIYKFTFGVKMVILLCNSFSLSTYKIIHHRNRSQGAPHQA